MEAGGQTSNGFPPAFILLKKKEVLNGLMDVSTSRWGYARYPSPVWTDETDHQYMRERLPNVYQVFGHTQQESAPIITEQYACLDCRRAFRLTSEGNFINA